jgi:hypothetical protein
MNGSHRGPARFTGYSAMAVYGAELPMQLQAKYAGSCPLRDLAGGLGAGGVGRNSVLRYTESRQQCGLWVCGSKD